jgi:hypothetical protein
MTARTAAVVTGLLVTLVALAGVGARASYGAQAAVDEPQYLLSTLSLAEDSNLDISDELADQRWRVFHAADLPRQTAVRPDGRQLSPHNPLLPVLLVPFVAVAGWIGAKVGLALAAGTLAAVCVLIAVRRLGVSPGPAMIVVGLFGASAPLVVYGTQVYPEIVAALAVAVGIWGVLGARGQRATAAAAAAVLAVIALPWLAVKYVPVAAVLALALLVRLRTDRRMARGVPAVLTVAAVTYLLAQHAIYGGWTPYAAGDHFTGGEFTVVGVDPDYLSRAQRLLGLLVDRTFGLIAWQPAFLFVFVALGWALRRRPPGWALLVGVALTGWLVATFVALTMHGWWFPGRQVVVVLPAVVLLLAVWAADSTRRLVALGAVGTVGVLSWLVLAWEATTGRVTLVVDFADTVNPWLRLVRPLLPDYAAVTPATWLLHSLWLVVAAGLVAWGWRSAGVHRDPAN